MWKPRVPPYKVLPEAHCDETFEVHKVVQKQKRGRVEKSGNIENFYKLETRFRVYWFIQY